MSKLFIVEGSQTKVLDQKYFDNEALLQNVVESLPEVIALDDLGVKEPFIVIGREVKTNAGYIDVLCIDGEGVLTVIETKLARNSQIRREVVGQVLEYVAQLTKESSRYVEQLANKYFAKSDIKIGERSATLMDYFATEELDKPESFSMNYLDMIDNNLQKGIIKLVIVSDSIPETLKETVTFINKFSKFDIYVLQIQSYQEDQMQIYVPTVFGFTHKSSGQRILERTQWDEESFFESISELEYEAIQTIQKLYEFTRLNADGIKWGTGKVSSSFSYSVATTDKRINIFAVLNQGQTGNICINFGSMKGIVSDMDLHGFRKVLNQLPKVFLPETVVDDGKYPNIPVGSILEPINFDKFTKEVLRLQEVAK